MRRGFPILFGDYMRVQCRYMRIIAKENGTTVLEAVVEKSASFKARMIEKHGSIVMEYCRGDADSHPCTNEEIKDGKSCDQ